ncbi:hypothetical protein [Sulfobacillus harzensis]|uniref:Zinc ribbon domain-containing protein n=1 Tax=Sulfobacillus harzensis TaxID=2729629 RepID=A0A7Y0Q1F6_9FIRM|nr:hypothetical protein [Sulfobacillus harzensis]NMP20776.1 hypothetical protein [Sulfobacillus harzensis]
MIVIVLLLWVVAFFVAAWIGYKKGRQPLGIVLGLFLGWVGVLIMALVGPTSEAARAEALRQGFPCPYCQEVVRHGATVCPHCQRDLPPTPAVKRV